MTLQLFDEIINRKNTSSVKWDDTEQIYGTKDVLPMWIADMDLKAPDVVLDAIEKRVHHGVFGYSCIPQSTRIAIQNWVYARQSWGIKEDWITFSNGIVPAIAIAIQALTNKGDKVIVQSPVYNPFYEMIEKNERKVVHNPLILNNGKYEMDFDDLKQNLDSTVKLLLLCNPHNPSGRIWNKDELQKLGEICLENNIVILSDEIHSDLILPNKEFSSLASLNIDFEQNTITCIAPSKTFNIAGLQASAIIIPNEEIRNRFKDVQQNQGFSSLNIFGAIAMEAAYLNGREWLDQLLLYLNENIEYAKNYLSTKLPKLRMMEPDASFLLWIDCQELNLSDAELQHKLIFQGKLALESGIKYGPTGSGFVRMNIACPRAVLEDGLNRLYLALHQL